jgi:orotidine-5'-phosphate decarboxylase
MIPEEKIIVALDMNEEAQLMKILGSLEGHKVWVKIGMELFYSMGPKAIKIAKEKGFKVFLDLKLHDIPTTVAQGMNSLAKLQVDMLNLHAAGGAEMMRKAADILKSQAHPPLLIAVTQLTSTSVEQMNDEQKISGDLIESVTHFAKLAKISGCDGVVSSSHEVPAIKLVCGSRFLTVTPGIRPLGTDMNDQKRITTPSDALRLGVDMMVIGRPITQAPHPKIALMNILKGN